MVFAMAEQSGNDIEYELRPVYAEEDGGDSVDVAILD